MSTQPSNQGQGPLEGWSTQRLLAWALVAIVTASGAGFGGGALARGQEEEPAWLKERFLRMDDRLQRIEDDVAEVKRDLRDIRDAGTDRHVDYP